MKLSREHTRKIGFDVPPMTPHWEHGYRCHGYWLGETLVGRVSIGPRACWTSADGWCWFLEMPGKTMVEGKAKSLRKAKQSVEQLYRDQLIKDSAG